MTYSAKVKFTFINDTPPQYSKTFPELLDEHSITMEAPAQDLNIHQYFSLFKSFLRAIDFSEYSIMDGACGVAFNGSNKEEDMLKLMEEYDLRDKYDVDDDTKILEEEIRNLKAKLSRLENPDNPNYTDEEMDAMMSWGGLVPGSDAAREKLCSCPVLDNQEMPSDRKWVNADCPIHGKKNAV